MISPRPNVTTTSSNKEGGSSAQTKRLSEVAARPTQSEAKTIDVGNSSGSAGQAKRTRQSNTNADLLKQSIRSEKVIKGNLNSKKSRDKSSAAANSESTKQGKRKESKDTDTNSEVKIKSTE